MEVLLTPRFFDNSCYYNNNNNQNKNKNNSKSCSNKMNNAWSPTCNEPNRYLSLAFESGWGTPPTTPMVYMGSPPMNNKLDGPPTMIYIPHRHGNHHNHGSDVPDDDAVSVLNDEDPDETDGSIVLPPATFDVLLPLFNEMHKEEKEIMMRMEGEAAWIDNLFKNIAIGA
jgi:hypothetical protein